MKFVRVNKTVTVDPVKISLFENTKNVHGMNISDFIDLKLDEFLNSSSPDEMHKIRIQTLETELLEAKQLLPEIEFMAKMRKQQQDLTKTEEEKPTNIWLEKYENGKLSLANQVNNKCIDWKHIQTLYGFNSAVEAETTILDKLREDRLTSCEHCRMWRSNEQYCKESKTPTTATSTCRNWKPK